MSAIVPSQRIERHILQLRGQRVMLSPHLAELYEVEPKVLLQSVKRNRERFPSDFMFQLTWEEVECLRSQFVTLDVGPGSPQNRPSVAFDARDTGSRSQSVTLNSAGYGRSRSQSLILKRGSNVKYLPYAFTEQGVAMLSSVLRSRRAVYDKQFAVVFDAIRQLMAPPPGEPKTPIGFRTGEPEAPYRRRPPRRATANAGTE